MTTRDGGADFPEGRGEVVVCGTDFSDAAYEAAQAAAALAIQLDLPLVLVHSIAETFREELPESAREALLPHLKEKVETEAARLHALGLHVEPVVLKGVPDQGLAAYVVRHHALLCVLGASMHQALGRFLTGNVAEVLAERLHVPALVVKQAAPFQQWTAGERALHVLVAADPAPEFDRVFRWVNWLRALGPLVITVAHVTTPAEDRAGIESQLREKAGIFLPGEPVEFRVMDQNVRVPEHLLDLAMSSVADLLVTGTHQYSGVDRLWHASISRFLLRHAPMSVACVSLLQDSPVKAPK